MMLTNDFHLSSLLLALNKIEDDVLSTESLDDASLLSKLETVVSQLDSMPYDATGADGSLAEILATTERIKIVLSTSIRLEDIEKEVLSDVYEKACLAFSEDDKLAENTKDSEDTPSKHMRKHFLSVLDDPYPGQAEKEAVVQAINLHFALGRSQDRELLRLEQLSLWYINARRRSGWSSILSKYARNERKRMKLLIQAKMIEEQLSIKFPLSTAKIKTVDAILQENLGSDYTHHTLQAFEEEWDALISWIKYGVKDKVSNWIQDIVEESRHAIRPKARPRAVPSPAKKSAVRIRLNGSAKPSRFPAVYTSESFGGYRSSSLDGYATICSGSSENSTGSSITSLARRQDSASPTLQVTKTRNIKALPRARADVLSDSPSKLHAKC